MTKETATETLRVTPSAKEALFLEKKYNEKYSETILRLMKELSTLRTYQ